MHNELIGRCSVRSYKDTLCKVAWGCFYWRVFLLSGLGRLFGFLLLPLKSAYRKAKRQCAACGRDKKHDGKNSRRAGVGKGKKDRASPEVRGAGVFCPVGVGWGYFSGMTSLTLRHLRGWNKSSCSCKSSRLTCLYRCVLWMLACPARYWATRTFFSFTQR